jgi:Fe-S cluster assembly ATP-binding protein
MAIPGVKLADFLRHATTNVRNPERKEGEELIPMREFRKELKAKMEQLRMDPSSPAATSTTASPAAK